MLQLRTLGDLALTTPAGVVKNRRELVLLAYLARRRGGRARRDELASLLWGASEMQRARHSLRQALVELRRWLGDSLDADGETIALAPGRVSLDLSSFDEAIDRGALDEAVDLWHGEFLTGFDGAGSDELRTWIEAERESSRRRLSRALEGLAARAQASGERAAALAICDRWSALLPLEERAHALAVDTLIDMGRGEAAAARYATAVELLERELGVTPGPALAAAGARVSTGDGASRIGSAALLAPDLVGRTHALDELHASWTAARAGTPTVVVVEGETGMGKTRLLLEFLWRIQSSAGDACILRSRGESRAEPLGVARALLDGLRSAPGLAAADPQTLADLSALLPELRRQFASLPAGDASGSALARAASAALREVAAEVPVILVVDDAEMMDGPSRAFLADVAARLEGEVLCVFTITLDRGDATAALRRLNEIPRLRRVRLLPLTDVECDAVVASMLVVQDAAKRRAQSAQIHAVTGGNPFHVVETVAALVDAGRIVPNPRGTWDVMDRDARDVVLPGTVREALERRVGLLDEEARVALRVIARARGPVDPAAAGLPAHGVDQLVARRLARDVDGRLELAHETIRAAALSSDPAWDGTRTLRRWRRPAILAASIAAAALVVVAGMNVMQRRAEARDIVPDRVALFPFAVNAPAELGYLDEGMVDLLAGSLDGAGKLRVVDPKAVLGHLEREARASGRRNLTTDEAASIARRFGAGLFVLGRVAGTRDTFEVTATLYGAQGERVGDARAAAAGEGRLFEMLGQLTRQLIASRYARSPEDVLATAALTTASIPALKAFLIGSQAVRAGHFADAVTHLRRAVAADPQFALAWYRLSLAASGMPDPGLYDSAVTRARALRDRLPPQERLLLEGSFFQHTGRLEDSERALNAALALNPFLIDTWERLAELRFHSGPMLGHYMGEAREPFERLLALDPENENAIVHLARIAAFERRREALDSLVERGLTIPGAAARPLELRALRAFTGSNAEEQRAVLDELSPNALQEMWDIGWRVVTFTENLDGFQQFADRVLRGARDDAWRAAGHVMRAHAYAAGGRFREADLATDSVQALVPHWGHLMRAAIALSWPSAGRVEGAMKSLESWNAETAPSAEAGPNTFAVAPPTRSPVLFRAAYLAQDAARHQDTLRLARYLRAIRVEEPPGKVYPHVHTLLTYARVRRAAAAGDFAEAVRSDTGPAFRKTQALSVFGSTPLFTLASTRELRGDVFAGSGDRRAALTWYRSVVEDLGFALIHHPAMHRRLGDVFTALGQPDSARVHYARFAELWRKADPDVASAVRAR